MTDEPIDRRRFLALAGVATTLAGCEHVDVRHEELDADAVGWLPEAAFGDERAAVEEALGAAVEGVAALMDAGD